MSKKNKQAPGTIIVNKKARFDFHLEDEYQAGLVLEGWEVKSLRVGRVNLTDSHVIIKDGEAYLLGAQIQPLTTTAAISNPDITRTRKLLLHRNELSKMIGQVERQGYTIVAVNLHWKGNRIKAKVALAKGKKQHDKRATEKNRDWAREKSRIMKSGNR